MLFRPVPIPGVSCRGVRRPHSWGQLAAPGGQLTPCTSLYLKLYLHLHLELCLELYLKTGILCSCAPCKKQG